MIQDYDDLRSLYLRARPDEEPTRNDKRAVRVALVSAGTATVTFHAASAAGKLLALVQGAGKVLTLGQIVLYAGVGAAVGGGLAGVGSHVSKPTPAAPVATIAPARREPFGTLAPAGAQALPRDDTQLPSPTSNSAPDEASPSQPAVNHATTQPLRQVAPPPAASTVVTPSNTSIEAAVPARDPSAPPPSLVDETRELAAVQSALNAHDAATALRLVDAQDRKFAGGNLVQERAAARVYALCAAGRTSDARAARERFLQAYPGSPLARRINSTCEK